MLKAQQALTLAELETFDPRAPHRGGEERRFCCPRCGTEKPRDASHRSLSLHTGTGVWSCHRCQQGGQLRDFWKAKEPARPKSRRERARDELRQWQEERERLERPEPTPEAPSQWREQLRGLVKLAGTAGAAYLQSRGVSIEAAAAATVRFHPAFYGRPAVVFPIRGEPGPAGEPGKLVAIQGRHTDGRDPKALGAGPRSRGVFAAAGAWEGDTWAIVEGPLCALSLAAAGLSAISVLGLQLPEWLPKRCAWGRGRRVLIASDADEAGDRAAEEWSAALRALGARPERFRPEVGKDFNDWHQADPEGLRAALTARLEASADVAIGNISPSRDALSAQVEAVAAAALLFDQCADQWDTETYERERDRLLRDTETTHAALAAAGLTWQAFDWHTGPGGQWHRTGEEPRPVAVDPADLAELMAERQAA